MDITRKKGPKREQEGLSRGLRAVNSGYIRDPDKLMEGADEDIMNGVFDRDDHEVTRGRRHGQPWPTDRRLP